MKLNHNQVEKAVTPIRQCMNAPRVPDEKRTAIASDFEDLWPTIQKFRREDAYRMWVSNYLEDEWRRRHDPPADEEQRSEPLCGCPSPTCPIKQGELPPSCHVHEGTAAEYRTAREAVRQEIERHPKPYALREADTQFKSAEEGPLGELFSLAARARNHLESHSLAAQRVPSE